jgi:DNA-binding MarR family transcriptional regulator
MKVVSSKNPTPSESLANVPTYRAGVAQSTTYRLLKKFTEDALSEHDLSMMQWFVIGTIYDAGDMGIGVTELSKIVDTNVPYITNMINLLENKGIVERSTREGNNRSKYIHIEPHYIATVEKIETDLRQKMRKAIYSNISPDELRVYISVLYKLANALAHDNDLSG